MTSVYGIVALMVVAVLIGYWWLRRPTHSRLAAEREQRDQRENS
jgi:hypothetical protein